MDIKAEAGNKTKQIACYKESELGLQSRYSEQVMTKIEDYLHNQAQTKTQHEYLLANDKLCLFAKRYPDLKGFDEPLVALSNMLFCAVGVIWISGLDIPIVFQIPIAYILAFVGLVNILFALLVADNKKLIWPIDPQDPFYQKDFAVHPRSMKEYNSKVEYLHSLGHKAREGRIKYLKEAGKWPEHPDFQSVADSSLWKVEKTDILESVFVWAQEWKKTQTGWTAAQSHGIRGFGQDEIKELAEYVVETEEKVKVKNQNIKALNQRQREEDAKRRQESFA